jgi:hypothetical protein
MKKESNNCSLLVREPPCTTWPPAWLTSSTPPRVAAAPKPSELPPGISPWDLPANLYERWEERVCIMHFDGKLAWREAEALALADVLGQSGPATDNAEAKPDPAPAPAKIQDPAAVVQRKLFPILLASGPYG